jgi:imidazolonepropionase-like amidohydrolase
VIAGPRLLSPRRLLRSGAGSLASLLILAGACSALAATPDAQVVLYRGATIIDVVAGVARPGAAILVRGEDIERVAATGQIIPPPGAKVVEVTGLYVTPGLINTHEHLSTPPNRVFAEAMMRRDLYGGVTAVRDMADDLRQVADLARAARVGEIPGPDIYYAALMAGPAFFDDPRSHATTAGAVAGAAPWMQAITSATDLPLAVARAAGTGATAIKIYADLPGERVSAITREAHRQRMLVWAHAAVFPASPAEVLDAGVDSVSHVCMLAYQASAAMPGAYHPRPPVDEALFQPGDNPVVGRLFATMRGKSVILDATLSVYAEIAREHEVHPDGPAPYCSQSLADRLANQAFRAGVMISAGTDGFSPRADPWPALQDELMLLQDKAGMRPADVLRSATLVGAMAVRLQGQMGTIQAGKLANLVFLSANPLANASAFKSVVLTVKRGAPYWRKDYRPVTPAEMTDDQ